MACICGMHLQVLRGKGDLPKARKDAMAAASNAKEFVSHCAAEGADSVTAAKMTVAQLRSALLVCAPVLPAISSFSLREPLKRVLNIGNFSIYAGTTGAPPSLP